MKIEIEPILIEQKSVLVQMMELYNYDFSLFSDDDINEHGYFGYSHIDDYWHEYGRFPYFIRVDKKLAGLVFIRSCCEYNELANPHNIAEFFIMQKYRRKGIGRYVAVKFFDMYKGGWEVSQQSKNVPAQKFWKSIIDEYTSGDFNVFGSLEEEHIGFIFDNSSY